MLIKNITPVVIAKDAENTIKETLSSLVCFQEVILYLNNTTDATRLIATDFQNVKIIDGDFIGFGPTKNKATDFASNDWILSLDSDEVILPQLLNEMTNLKLENNNEVFIIKRDNYFLGKEVKYSGWGKDYLVRLYNRKNHQFNQNIVHEFVVLNKDTKKITLKNSFKHNAVTDINQFLVKIIKYSDLASKDKKTCCFLVGLVKAKWAFLKTYFLQLGFLDGWRGFLIATFACIGKFLRFVKRYMNCTKGTFN